ncbi:hypothetical protein F4009_24805 [Candidatus Poribacteria bacterium]|nr:hypothetical protein [Candidatus Poribacteria bacterium]MYH80526.1 hypothetical protein [Candidatus Poribacteria bacterium]MYK97178.1 hypothetical protein [Candidatus Poribacteria bacterium]
MKIGSTFHILVLFIALLGFSMSSVLFAQQNTERVEAIIAAEQDATASVNQGNWWVYGSCLIGVIAADKTPQPPAARLVGKSPEYVEAYTQAYEKKVQNLQRSAATPGRLTTVFSAGILAMILSSLD